MLDKSIVGKNSLSESDNTNTPCSLSSNLTILTYGIWTINVPHLFVEMVVEEYSWESKRPITLNDFGPKIQT